MGDRSGGAGVRPYQAHIVAAAKLCQNPEFWRFARERFNANVTDEDQAATFYRQHIRIASRVELRDCSEARERHGQLFWQFNKYLQHKNNRFDVRA